MQSDFARSVPIVTDKALIDLVNGLSVTSEGLSYRRRQGAFQRVLSTLTGARQKHDDLLLGNLHQGQAALTSLTQELMERAAVSDHALTVVTNRLNEVVAVTRETKQRALANAGRIDELETALADLARRTSARLADHEARLERLEARVLVDTRITAWEGGQSYSELPPLLQILWLAWEVWSIMPPALTESDLESEVRDLLVNRICRELRGAGGPSLLSIPKLLDATVSGIPQEYREEADWLIHVDGEYLPPSVEPSVQNALALAFSMHATAHASKSSASVGLIAQSVVARRHPRLARTMDRRALVQLVVDEVRDARWDVHRHPHRMLEDEGRAG